jgi:hypothetical protein
VNALNRVANVIASGPRVKPEQLGVEAVAAGA